MATTDEELATAERLAGEAVNRLARAEAALARPGSDTPTEAQLRRAAQIRIAVADAAEALRLAGLHGSAFDEEGDDNG